MGGVFEKLAVDVNGKGTSTRLLDKELLHPCELVRAGEREGREEKGRGEKWRVGKGKGSEREWE